MRRMSDLTEVQIIEKIRETADRAFEGIGIKKKWRSEVEQKPTDLGPNEVFMESTKSMVWNRNGFCWCEYRVEIRHELWANLRVTVRGVRMDRMNVEVDDLTLDEDTDFTEFCKALRQKLEKRAKHVTSE